MQCSIAQNSVHSLQKRCLQILSPDVTKHEPPTRRAGKAEKVEPVPVAEKKEKNKTVKTGPITKVAGASTVSERPPTRRIQRPTSIRRPKLIGKSVEGAAVQAMAASRARASANRGSSPFQKASKGSKSMEVAAADRKAATSAASHVTRIEAKDCEQQLTVLDQNPRQAAAELSKLVKHYIAAMSRTAASPFHHSRIVQTMTDKYWLSDPERPIGPAARNFLLTRSVHMWSRACEPFGFPDCMMKDISGYFAQWLKMSNAEYNLLQLDAPSRSPSELSPSSTLIVELKRIYHRKLCVVLKTTLKFKSDNKEPTLRCDAWMILLSRVGDDVRRPNTRRHARKTVQTYEREATLIDKKVCSFGVSAMSALS